MSTELTHYLPTPPLMISKTSSVPIDQKLEGRTKSGNSPAVTVSRGRHGCCAAAFGHNSNEHRLASWDKALQGEFANADE